MDTWTEERREARAASQRKIWAERRQAPEKFQGVIEAISKGRAGKSVGTRKGIGGWTVKDRESPKCLEGCTCNRHDMKNSGQFKVGSTQTNSASLNNLEIWREKQKKWKNGTSYQGKFTYTLRSQVWTRDQNQCQDCGQLVKAGEMKGVVHHINFDKSHNYIENLILLCRSCHIKRHYQNGRIQSSI